MISHISMDTIKQSSETRKRSAHHVQKLQLLCVADKDVDGEAHVEYTMILKSLNIYFTT